LIPALLFYVALVTQVREYLARNDMASAERTVAAVRAQNSPEVAAAISWLARAALERGQQAQAEKYARDARTLTLTLLKRRKLDADEWLPTALGASIEVQAQVMAARGERADAVHFLREQLTAFAGTSIVERIQKNINLLDLEGKPAPALDWSEALTARPPALRGRPQLIFFWAHWCSDCKAMEPVVFALAKAYASKGLVLIAPTKRYGYVANGKDASPQVERSYIDAVHQQFFREAGTHYVPLSSANFRNFGASSTPTLVLVDSAGILRLYNPGLIAPAALAARLSAMLGR